MHLKFVVHRQYCRITKSLFVLNLNSKNHKILKQGSAPVFFNAYKKLRAKGYQFPVTNVAQTIKMYEGAEKSPALNPNLANSTHSTEVNSFTYQPLEGEEIANLKNEITEAKHDLIKNTEKTINLTKIHNLKTKRLRLAALIQFKTDLLNLLYSQAEKEKDADSVKDAESISVVI